MQPDVCHLKDRSSRPTPDGNARIACIKHFPYPGKTPLTIFRRDRATATICIEPLYEFGPRLPPQVLLGGLFLLPALPTNLTEGPSILLVLSAWLCLFNSARASTTGVALAWAAVGGLVSNFALMVQPANLTLMLAFSLGLAASLVMPRTFT